jgi:predicted amidohydrolase
MSCLISFAAVQMQVTPSDVQNRLERAEQLLQQAAQAGAQLIALPEVFNTGYAYQDENYQRAEPLDGVTVRWMKACAARYNVHLAGSLLLRDGEHIYNALLLIAPDGRLWRYDKCYPWGWERAYFRPGRSVRVAETELGRFGLLICWDVAHPGLWRQYAGKVDAMVVCSCPPDFGAAQYRLPGGALVHIEEMGPVMQALRQSAQHVFGAMMAEQVAWLQVPAVYATGSGVFESHVPAGRASLLSMALQSPRLFVHLPQADELSVRCPMTHPCWVLGADGNVLAQQTTDRDGWILAEVGLPNRQPTPQGGQPRRRVSPLAYLISDRLLPLLCLPLYEQNRRRLKWKEVE